MGRVGFFGGLRSGRVGSVWVGIPTDTKRSVDRRRGVSASRRGRGPSRGAFLGSRLSLVRSDRHGVDPSDPGPSTDLFSCRGARTFSVVKVVGGRNTTGALGGGEMKERKTFKTGRPFPRRRPGPARRGKSGGPIKKGRTCREKCKRGVKKEQKSVKKISRFRPSRPVPRRDPPLGSRGRADPGSLSLPGPALV